MEKVVELVVENVPKEKPKKKKPKKPETKDDNAELKAQLEKLTLAKKISDASVSVMENNEKIKQRKAEAESRKFAKEHPIQAGGAATFWCCYKVCGYACIIFLIFAGLVLAGAIYMLQNKMK